MQLAAVEEIAAHISRHRFVYADERQLQEGLAALLEPDHVVEREVRLNARDRLDLLVDDTLCIETKIAGTPRSVRAQIDRYAQHPDVKAILLITSRVRHSLPREINGKPVVVAMLGRHAL